MKERIVPDMVKQNALRQQLIIGAWGLGLAVIVFLWTAAAFGQLTSSFIEAVGAIARLLGLLATYAALTQLLLMGRIWWIERPFGLDQLARFHRLNGYAALIFLVSHASLIVLWHSFLSGRNYLAEYVATVRDYQYVFWAFIAELLFITVVISSIYIARKHLKFETWYYVHLLAYLAISLAALHQFTNGTTLLSTSFATLFWYGLYGFVFLNLLVWRFGVPVYRFATQDFRVVKVEQETPTVTSIYIQANDLSKLTIHSGQFILVRFLTKQLWWQEHPFTVSMMPHDNLLRISVRDVGDYTHSLQSLQVGAKVMVSGPFGRFTAEKSLTNKRLFIAGGIGITPIRAMLEEALQEGCDSVVLYANRTPDDVPLRAELEATMAKGGGKIVFVYSDADNVTGENAETGRIDANLIKKYAPDFMDRDVYLCGPPPMMKAISTELEKLDFPIEQLHTEKFALHP